jgi:DNA-directed RNA polymerase subunit omega
MGGCSETEVYPHNAGLLKRRPASSRRNSKKFSEFLGGQMEIPQLFDSKFRFILVAARRARQLHAGARALVQTPYKKTTKIAVAELEAGLVPFEILPVPAR